MPILPYEQRMLIRASRKDARKAILKFLQEEDAVQRDRLLAMLDQCEGSPANGTQDDTGLIFPPQPSFGLSDGEEFKEKYASARNSAGDNSNGTGLIFPSTIVEFPDDDEPFVLITERFIFFPVKVDLEGNWKICGSKV